MGVGGLRAEVRSAGVEETNSPSLGHHTLFRVSDSTETHSLAS